MWYRIIITLIIGSFVVFGANQSMNKNLTDFTPVLEGEPDKKWQAYDSLMKVNQPNAGREQLRAILDQGVESDNTYDISRAIYSFSQTLSPLLPDERVEIFVELYELTNELKQPSKSLSKIFLVDQLMNNPRLWVPYNADVLPVAIGSDTVELHDDYKRAQFIFSQVDEISNDMEALKKHSLSPFEDFIPFIKKEELSTPTVFDFTSVQLIHFYQHYSYNRYYEWKKTDELDSKCVGTPKDFVTADLDSKILQNKVLKVYQKWEDFHIEDTLILSQIHYHRLNYLFSENSSKRTEENWGVAMNYYGEQPARSKFLYEIARLRYNSGKNYHFRTNKAPENHIVEAHKMLKDELDLFPDNDFKETISKLIKVIEQPTVELKMNNFTYPGDLIPLMFEHRNIDSVTLHIFEKKSEAEKRYSYHELIERGHYEKLRDQKIVLTDRNDFQKRNTEMLIDGIKKGGEYFALITENNVNIDEIVKKDSLWRNLPKTTQQFTVSEIFVSTMKTEDGIDFLATDFKTGKPIEGAKVELFYSKNYNILPNTPNKTGKTGENGWYSASLKDRNINYIYTVSWNDSEISSNDYFYKYNSYELKSRVNILTDRAIYRPGQTVHYKVIAYEGEDNDFKIKPNEKLTVTLYDNSYNSIYEKTITTNEFGSINASIPLPLGGSLGQFRLEVRYNNGSDYNSNSNHSFRVEEYKRPTFETHIDLPEEEAKLNDSVRVKGTAKAFTGYPITGAKVNYRIYRTWSTYWRYYGGNSQGRDLILDSTVNSDEKGEFELQFFAATDPNASENAHYNFEIIAEVSDVSGETHEARTNLNLSKTGLRLTCSGKSELRLDETEKAVFNVVNMAGKSQEGYEGELKVYKLNPSPLFKNRIWKDAEFQKYDKEKWEKLFPYAPESSYDSTKSNEELFNSSAFKVGDSININELLKNEQGKYRLEAETISEKGDTIKFVQQLSMIDVKSIKLLEPIDLWSYISTTNAKIGESIDFQLGSSFEGAKAFVQLRRGTELIQEEWMQLDKRKSLSYTVKEKDRGNLSFSAILIYDGKPYTTTRSVNVPFDNKELTVKASTFRDKLLPGQEEEWKFTVSGKNADKIAAEVCAGMYDASLDQFAQNYWSLWPYRGDYYYADYRNPSRQSTMISYGEATWRNLEYELTNVERTSRSEFLGGFVGTRNRQANYYYDGSNMNQRSFSLGSVRESTDTDEEVHEISEVAIESEPMEDIASKEKPPLERDKADSKKSKSGEEATQKPIQIRENFNETAFFYPDLRTNEKGEFVVSFTLPESLTEWKFMALAHTKDLKSGGLNLKTVAQKPLMVTSNAPRFFRVGDRFDFASKVVNLTDEEQTVEVKLSFFDPTTDESLNLIGRQPQTKMVTIPANESKDVIWNLDLSNQSGIIAYKITASNEEFSDGEQKPIPILTNRQLVTEALPFVITKKGTTNLSFEPLKNNNSKSLKHERFTFEYTANPAWNAVLALPYLAEYPYECAEQLFSRYYANRLAQDVIDKKPKIKTLFETWRKTSPDVFMSELEKNEALKTILLEETPWVLDAKSESERRRRIGELFEINQLARSQEQAIHLLSQKQNGDGGFGWFGGNRSNVYITQHIVSGFGHLKNLGIDLPEKAESMIVNAIGFLNQHHTHAYNKMTEKQKERYGISSITLHWLYATTYFSHQESTNLKEVKAYHHKKLQENWTKLSLQQQALAGMYFLSVNDEKHEKIILESLQDRAKNESDKGMYFPENNGGYYWDQDKIGSQALIIEFFVQAEASKEEIDALRLWLILQKRSNAWENTKSTALATYALLLNGTDYLADDQDPTITIGGKQLTFVDNATEDQRYVKITPGQGHFQTTWSGEEVRKKLADITIDKPTSTPSIGAIYWQYFEDMKKVKASSNPDISIKKLYRRVVAGAKGDEYEIDSVFEVGERVNIKLVITVDNDMEYVHVKDLRPAGFEPKMAVSQHQWKNDLWYYQSPRDVSMNYFIDRLPKGTHVLNYEVFATNSGQFDSGNATVQCMYAPEFVAHSGGKKVRVKR
ncbi:MAG: alpha-2-macroglobulin family protein [Brumimicrobium sp.]